MSVRKIKTGRRILSGVAIAPLLLTGPVWAQDSTFQSKSNTAADSETNHSDNVIIVTARKREQTLQDIPISVSVTDGEVIELAQIRDLIDLQTVAPSLRVAQLQSSTTTNFIIRGFGNGANNPGIEPSVGVFIDGVYRSRSAAQIGDLPNVERIEVLRGPQSTLFGKNASAGIVSIVTQSPEFEYGGSAELSYGNYNAVIARGNITGPISRNLAFSLSGSYNRRDGYARDLNLGTDFNDRNRWGVRGQLLWEPSPELSFRVIGDFDRIDENCCVATNVVNGPTGGAIAAIGGSINPENPFSENVFNNRRSINEIENYGISLQGDYEFSDITLTSITAYRQNRSDANQDSDFTSAELIRDNIGNIDIDTFTQELRLTSDFDGPFNFLLGGYYFHEDIFFENDLIFGADARPYFDILSGGQLAFLEAGVLNIPVGSFFQSGQGLFDEFDYSNDAFSIFGTVDFEVTDKLTFSAGFSYTDDSKRVSSNVISTDPFSALDFVAIGNQVITQQGIAQGIGNILMLGRPATAAEVGAFAGANPAAFGQVQAGAGAFAVANNTNPAVNPLLALRPLQFLPPFLNFPNAVEDGRTSDSDFSYTLRANYELTDAINIYFTNATGFKASSFNLTRDSRPFAADFIPGSPATNPPTSSIRSAGLALPNLTAGTRFAGPEEAELFELGLKAKFDRVAFNLALFTQTLEGFQGNTFTGTGFTLINAGSQSTDGIEFDTTVTPIDPLTLTFAMTYLDADYDSFVDSPVGDLTGRSVGGVPEVSMATSATYTHDFTNGSNLVFRLDYLYESQVAINDGLPTFNATLGNSQIFEREVNLVNGAIALKLNDGLEFSVWGRNLLNDRYLTSVFDAVAQTGSVSGIPNQPRTYGGTFRFKF